MTYRDKQGRFRSPTHAEWGAQHGYLSMVARFLGRGARSLLRSLLSPVLETYLTKTKNEKPN